jgi:hypothetical protein
MPYRYNSVDVIVGVGMCAIIFGALLLVVATNGTYQTALPEFFANEESIGARLGMTWLQPAIGRAIVDQALFERRADREMARSATEWNRATLASHEFESLPGGPFGEVARRAVIVPIDHLARVQSIMGRAIVNMTQRGIRSGVLSADLYLSDYNQGMIRAIEARGQRLDREFASTWQATLGGAIVEAIRNYRIRAAAIQERMGTALVQLTRAQIGSEAVRAAQQEQMASLVVAEVRTEALAERLTLLAAIQSFPEDSAAALTEPSSWPEIPVGYMLAAGLALAALFFGGLALNARSRESKALAEMQRQTARWVYRVAA